jgi:hypothetical protein
MHILESVLPYTPHHDLIPLLVPLENGTGTDTQFSTNFRRH